MAAHLVIGFRDSNFYVDWIDWTSVWRGLQQVTSDIT